MMVRKADLSREIIDSLSDALIVLDPALDLITINDAAETLIETSRPNRTHVERLLQRNLWLRGMVMTCLETGQNLDNPDGSLLLERRPIAVTAEVSPLIDAAGNASGAIVLLHNLSHRRSAERALDASEGVFKLSPAGLAHEVKNPLTGIKGATELLATMFQGDTRAQQYCRLILDGVNRITGLVEQVLSVSSPQRLKREPVNIHQVLHQALKMAGLFPETPDGIVIEQSFDPSLPAVTGDSAALERVFLNLVRNAHESLEGANRAAAPMRPVGMIRLYTAMETHFRLNSRGRRRQFLRVEVSDNGRGMAPGELKQLFTPFFTTKAAGTGLGLVLSQRIVLLHGGKLWAELGGPNSRPGGRDAAGFNQGADLPSQSAIRGHGSNSSKESMASNSTTAGMTFCVVLPVGPD
ncbi:MAG TPA: ATP-binding protein [Candidatus Binataceae bacterium]|nr:ATP-binding protein [Candidatus Binataceae bacterium]